MQKPDFAAVALARFPIRVLIEAADGSPRSFEATILPLWHETERAPGQPHERPDTWRVLEQTAEGLWFPALVNEGLAMQTDIGAHQLAPVEIRAGGVVDADSRERAFIELLAVAARFKLRTNFGYQKVAGGGAELRRGVPCGFRGDTVYVLDADRADALRGFKRDGMARLCIELLHALPCWFDGQGYVLCEERL